MKNKQKKNIQVRQKKPLQSNITNKKETIAVDIPGWSILAVLLFTALIYTRALYNGFVHDWDDDVYITFNTFIQDFSLNGIVNIFSSFQPSGNYHPLTTLTDLFIYKWFGLNPLPYHLLNVLLHLLNTWLVYKLTEQLSGKKISAIIVSLLFAVHPMHVESVAWISELKDVLYTVFFLLSLITYLRFLKSGYQKKNYIFAILYFTASLLSKSAAITLPIILIAIDIYKGRKINARLLLEKVPFLILSLFFGILAILSQQAKGAITDLSVTYSFINKIFIYTHSLAFYIVKLIAPVNLSAMHYYPLIQGEMLPVMHYISLPFLLIISWIIYKGISFRKEKVFGICFFLITMSVMLQILPVGGAFAAERYTYVSYIGLFYIAGQGTFRITKKRFRNIAIALLSLYIILISYLTWDRIGYWKNTEKLFTDVIKKNPNRYHGYMIRGMARNYENLPGALDDYNKIMEYDLKKASIPLARGFLRYKIKDYKGALEDFNKAISLDITIPEAYNGRGSAYEELGDFKSAMINYNKAIALNPKLASAYNNRGVLKAKTDDLVGAIKDINKAIEINPGESKAYSDRGHIKAIKKKFKESIEDFNIALKLKPDDEISYYNRGNARFDLKDTSGACEDWEKSSKLGYDMATEALKKNCH